MKSACGIDYAEASLEIDYHEINGVRIPFASPLLLWRTKAKTHREKTLLIFSSYAASWPPKASRSRSSAAADQWPSPK